LAAAIFIFGPTTHGRLKRMAGRPAKGTRKRYNRF
jgi:hypothetical protein